MISFRKILVPLAFVAGVALFAACGGSGGDTTGDAQAVTDTTATDAGRDGVAPPDDSGPSGCNKPEDCVGRVANLGTCQVAGCNDQGQCVAMDAPAGAACDDDDACTSADVCGGDGTCAGAPIADCHSCGAAADCDAFEDGDACNGTLKCEAGACQLDATTIVECPADDDCATYACNATTGACDGTAINEGGACEGDVAVLCATDFVCEAGECVCPGCEPACEGMECGADGCGGECAPGCGVGEACAEGVCVPCEADCTGRACGDDGCGGTCAPGCGAGEMCDAAGQCVCEPSCGGKVCGDDGCGGTCAPGCAANEACNAAGQCECVPACGGKECGDDGCGGDCGTCVVGDEECTASGRCIPAGCVPDCTGLSCGLDPECGDSCGTCGAFEDCVDGACELTDPCYGVDDVGCCEGDIVVFCIDGMLDSIDCGGYGLNCGWNDEAAPAFYDCTTEATSDPAGGGRECGAFPACETTCEAAGVECGVHPECPWLTCGGCGAGEVCDTEVGECVADPCQGVSFQGCCLDGDVLWCEEGQIFAQSCGAEDACGWVDDAGYFVCGGTDPAPAGTEETCPAIECATTCVEEGISCGAHPGCPWIDCGGCGDGQACSAGACVDVTTVPLSCDVQVTGNNEGGSSFWDAYSCSQYDGLGTEVVYELTPAQDGDVAIYFNTDPEAGGVELAGDVEIYVLAAPYGGGDCVPAGYGDNGTVVSLQGGVTYFVVIDGYQGATSDYALVVDCAAECAESGCTDRECGPAPGAFCMGFDCPPGCGDAELCDEELGMCEAIPTCDATLFGGELACGDAPTTTSGTTVGGTNTIDEYVGCGAAGYTGPEVYYSFTPSCDGPVTVTLSGLETDLALLVLEGTCRADFCVNGSDGEGTADEVVTFDAAADTTYFILVEGWDGAESPFDLTVNCGCTCVPDCSGVECGPDPVCGQDCGGCGDGLVCGGEGTCVSDPCLGVTDTGCCAGDVSYTCTENGLAEEDCGGAGCGWNDFFGLFGWYGCGGIGEDPYGEFPLDCDFAACDNASFCAEQGWECGTGCPGESCGACGEGQYCGTNHTCQDIALCTANTFIGDLACGDGPTTTTGDTSDSVNELPGDARYSCNTYNYDGPEEVYTFTPSCSGDVTITLQGPAEAVDMDLLVLEGECSIVAPCMGDSTGGAANESVTFYADADTTYYVVIEGFGADSSGAYDLTVDCACTCTPNCDAVECGPDPVCGTDCGGCEGGLLCVEGVCETDPCQGLTFEGCCDAGTAVWCEGGEIQAIRCGEDLAITGCGWVDPGDGTGWFFCGGTDTPPVEFPADCPALECATTCAAEGLDCGPLPGCPWIDCGGCDAGDACSEGACLPDPCAGVPNWGCCDGDVLKRCLGGEYYESNCADDGSACGWYPGDGSAAPGYYCGGDGADPNGDFPAACDMAACDNDALCLAWERECGPGCPGMDCGTCADGSACDGGACVVYVAKTCDTPAVLACGDVLDGSTVLGANLLEGYQACEGYTEEGPDDVYWISLPTTQEVTITLSGMAADLDLYLLPDSCSPADCGVNSTSTGTETITFTAEAEVTYYVVVDGYGGASDDYQIALACEAACVPDCGAAVCGPDPTCGTSCGTCDPGEVCMAGACEAFAGGTCAAPAAIACGDSVAGSNVGAPANLDGYTCSNTNGASGEIVYALTLDADQEVVVDLTGLAADLDLYVLAGDCDPASCPGAAWKSNGSGDEQVTFPGTAGTTYYIVADGYGAAESAFDLAVTCGAPCVPDCTGLECGPDPVCGRECGPCGAASFCDGGVCTAYAGFTCAAPGALACGETVQGDTGLSADLLDEYACDGSFESGGDDVYALTVTAGELATITLTGMMAELDLFLLEVVDGGEPCGAAACIDSSATSLDEVITFTPQAGATYYAVVDGFFGDTDAYSLSLTCGSACAEPTGTLSCENDLVVADTTGAANDIDSYGCVVFTEDGPEHIYAFTAPADGDYTFAIFDDADVDLDLFVLDSTCNPQGGCLAYGDDLVTITASAGETYYIVVDGYQAGAGVYHLVLTCASVEVVAMSDNAFVLNDITVAQGTTVRWVNLGNNAHTSTSTSDPVVWDSGNVPPGGSYEFTFDTVGAFPYQCSYHATMTGTVNVVAP